MNDELKITYEKYTNLAFHRRGVILNETIMLERLIDEIIAHYFCGLSTKKQELMELIICTNRMIFENKIQVLKVLLERHKPDFLKSNPTAINDITQKIIPERNIFAHYWLVTSSDMPDFLAKNQTVFIKFKNTTEHIYYDDFSFSEVMTVIGNSIRVFMKLQRDEVNSIQ